MRQNDSSTSGKLRRKHFKALPSIRSDGELGFAIPGKQLLEWARYFAPTVEQTRQTLLRLRITFDISRGVLAANLGVSESTLRSWETGRRNPLISARRLIWFLDLVAHGDAPANLILWRADPGQGGEH